MITLHCHALTGYHLLQRIYWTQLTVIDYLLSTTVISRIIIIIRVHAQMVSSLGGKNCEIPTR